MEDKSDRISASIAPANPGFPPGTAPRLGILMLDTRFPRPQGDLGNAASWGVATESMVVPGVGPQEAVQTAEGLRASQLLPAFERAARQLVERGVAAITTSCGFLVLLQDELARASPVPVVTSSLLQLPALLEDEAQVGVLTVSAERLGEEHLRCAGVTAGRIHDVVVEGMPQDSTFVRAILGNQPGADMSHVAHEVVAASLRLKARAPRVRTLVLECTNLPPYAQAIEAATGWRVLSLVDSPVLRGALGNRATLKA